MILADTSIWIDHLNRGDPVLERLLRSEQILMHPVVFGEMALGSVRNRAATLAVLAELPRVLAADDDEVLRLIEDWELPGTGIGYADAHLLAAVLLAPGTRLWARDKKLRGVAQQLSLDAGLS